MSSSALAAEILADSPVVYWPFSEASGTFLDASGNGRHATENGSVTRSVSMGALGNGITLAGASGYISGPNTFSLVGGTQFTFAIWVNIPSAPGANSTLFMDNGFVYFWVEPSGALDGYDFRTSGNGARAAASSLLSFATLHQIVAVCDISVGVTYYIDGVAAGTVSPGGAGSAWTDTNTGLGLYIGQDSVTSRPLVASVAHAAVFPSALSASRVAAQYAAGIFSEVAGSPNQTAYRQIDENVGFAIGTPSPDATRQIDENVGVMVGYPDNDATLQTDQNVIVDPYIELETSPVSISISTQSAVLSTFRDTKLIIDDNRSTAPHGLYFQINVVEDVSYLRLFDFEDDSWEFKMVGAFHKDDVIYGSSEANDQYLYLKRGSTVVSIIKLLTPDSNWPVVFPGENRFQWDPMYVKWVQAWYYPTYWGV